MVAVRCLIIILHCRRNISDAVINHRLLMFTFSAYHFMTFPIIITRRLKKSVCGSNHYVVLICFHHKICISKPSHNINSLIEMHQTLLKFCFIRKQCRIVIIGIYINMRKVVPIMILFGKMNNFFINFQVVGTEENIMPPCHLYHYI